MAWQSVISTDLGSVYWSLSADVKPGVCGTLMSIFLKPPAPFLDTRGCCGVREHKWRSDSTFCTEVMSLSANGSVYGAGVGRDVFTNLWVENRKERKRGCAPEKIKGEEVVAKHLHAEAAGGTAALEEGHIIPQWLNNVHSEKLSEDVPPLQASIDSVKLPFTIIVLEWKSPLLSAFRCSLTCSLCTLNEMAWRLQWCSCFLLEIISPWINI